MNLIEKTALKCILTMSIALALMVAIMAIPDKAHAEDGYLTIDVNKATHTLTLRQGENIISQYDVITGKPGTPTPSFTTSFNTITINPTWNPAAKSQAHFRKHPELRSHYALKRDKNGRFYSLPGEKNPMGKARFELLYSKPIRIHGTSEPELFQTDRRNYSSGCVRVLEIQQLVTDILGDQVKWDKSYSIKLPYKINVIVH